MRGPLAAVLLRGMVKLVAAFAASLPLFAVAAYATVVEAVEEMPYAVSGATEAQVRADINAKRSGHYDAQTKWQMRWRYWYQSADGTCAISRVKVTLDIAFVMPKLVSTDPALRTSFDGYIEKLKQHEDGHADIARDIARRIDSAIARLSAESCDALGRRANALGHELIREGSALQAAYDARTEHGATQGARWPRRAAQDHPDTQTAPAD